MEPTEYYLLGTLIITGIGALVGLFRSKSSPEGAAINTLGGRVAQLSQLVASLAATIGSSFKSFASLFKKLWENVLKPLFKRFYQLLLDLSTHLKQWFKPIIKFLTDLKRNILKFYDRWVRPVLDAIDVARRVLGIAASLGVDWAKELEIKLQQIEDKIRQPFVELVDAINTALGWIDRIIGLDGLLQRVTLLKSMFKYRRDVINFGINSIVTPLSTQQRIDYNQPQGQYGPGFHANEVADAVVNRAGKLYSRGEEDGADLARLALNGGQFFV